MKAIAIVIIVPLAVGIAVWAQTPDTATLEGHITDQSKAPVDAAEVTVTNPITGLRRAARTTSEGNFVITGLPAGARLVITWTFEKRVSPHQF